MYEYTTNWAAVKQLDNYPELERIAAENAVHGTAELPSELTALWDEEIRADAMDGVI